MEVLALTHKPDEIPLILCLQKGTVCESCFCNSPNLYGC